MILRLLSNIFQRFKPQDISISEQATSASQTLKPQVHRLTYGEQESVSYVTPNELTTWRVKTLFTKEPDTIDWISHFSPNEILLDIGANVGMYSIWAAKTRGIRVYAFEPESQNYALLNQNIHLNKLSSSVTAFCVAVSDRTGFDRLFLSSFSAGGSCHSFGEEVDFNLKEMKSNFEQGAYSASLDYLLEVGAIELPNYIKIDVDGLEHKIIAGGAKLLQDPKLKSILIEVNSKLDSHLNALNQLKNYGFTWDEAQVAQSRRASGAFEGVGNYVCVRH